ncbi:O-antigen ligase family protein [Aliarcobacter butzleri]|uniref:O-antigen ligase family protein n=3 Tax=Aliarcobacter butzleri TaxID=28197 RepID=UPI00125FEAA8|nr:O-antigen ligase family protein [Aliarcobacter butzleri]MCT7573052.1 O-antigen ligase family protein [Aliarcobacter butzleri]MCT7603774.1 O-antigen ligase family protein [Aliarcobacter butzleri]MCT7648185.1 O-antigen ligase family protein [Aliarcobacter butzleri]MDN5095938.1 O-antigen ligase family protein [Aliarcobacter butzleri]
MNLINKICYVSKENQNKITLLMNHLLVVYAFLIPISNKAKTSVFFCILLLFLYRRNFIDYFKIAFKNELLKYFILLYLVFLFGMFYTSDMDSAYAFMNKAKFLIYPLIFLSFLDMRFSFRILNAFIFGVLFSEIVSYLIHFQIIPPELFIGEYKVYQTVYTDPAPFLNHIKHNIALAIVISVLIYRLLVNDIKNIYLKILSFIFITTAFINMSLIGGRTGYIVLFLLIFLVVFLVYRQKIKKVFFISLSIILIMFMYMYNFSEQFDKRVEDAKNDIKSMINEKNYDSSIGLRIIASYYTIEVIKDNYLVGVGTGDVMQEIEKLSKDKESYIVERVKSPHNVYLQVLAQVGIIGFFIFLLMFYKILKYKSVDKKRTDIIKIVTISSLIFMIPGNFFEFFELAMFVTIISAMISNYKFDVFVKEVDYKSILKYILVIIIFLIIGITK